MNPCVSLQLRKAKTETLKKLMSFECISSMAAGCRNCEHEPHLLTGNWFGVYGVLSALQGLWGLFK